MSDKKSRKDEDLDYVEKELNAHSGSLSSSVRVVAFSMIAALWAISSAAHIQIPEPLTAFGLWVFLLSVSILFLDFLQHLFGYWSHSAVFDKRDKNLIEELKYDRRTIGNWPWLGYRASFLCFLLKLLLTGLTVSLFLFLIAKIL